MERDVVPAISLQATSKSPPIIAGTTLERDVVPAISLPATTEKLPIIAATTLRYLKVVALIDHGPGPNTGYKWPTSSANSRAIPGAHARQGALATGVAGANGA